MNVTKSLEKQNLGRGHFFAIDRRAWEVALGCGMNAAIAYLLMARGSGRDMRTTSWSAQAMHVRTSVSWTQCNLAVKALLEAGLVRQLKGGRHPRYVILTAHEVLGATAGEDGGVASEHRDLHPIDMPVKKADADLTWLPNALTDGVVGESPPIKLIRQTFSVNALRLLIEFYSTQSLNDFGGVHWQHIQQSYECKRMKEQGSHVLWGFAKRGIRYAKNGPFIAPYLNAGLALDDAMNELNGAFELLSDLGLIEVVGHVIDCESDEGAVLHPYALDNGEDEERAIGRAAHAAGLALLTARMRAEVVSRGICLLPMKKHISNVQVVGLVRTRYRARTRNTAAWMSKDWSEWFEFYATMQARARATK